MDHDIEGTDTRLKGSVFYQTTKDIISPSQIPTVGSTLQSINIGHSETAGIELGAEGRFNERWDWDVNYTAQRVRDNLSLANGAGTVVPYNAEDSTPVSTVNAHVGYTRDKWEADVYGQYVSNYEVLRGTTSTLAETDAGGGVGVAARVGYKILDNTTVALSGTELTRSDSVETSGPEKERQIFLSLTSSF